MGKKNQINLDLSAILRDAGFTAPQVNVLYSLLEENIIEAAKLGVGISVGTIFDIAFSRKAKNPLLIIKMRRRFAERVRYHGKKKYENEVLENETT